MSESQWREVWLLFSKPDINTGKPIKGPVMMRKINGVKQYRAMDADEEKDFFEQNQW